MNVQCRWEKVTYATLVMFSITVYQATYLYQLHRRIIEKHVSDLHLKFALRPQCHTMCGSMADIQSATAEIRRGKKDRKNKRQGKNIMVCRVP